MVIMNGFIFISKSQEVEIMTRDTVLIDVQSSLFKVQGQHETDTVFFIPDSVLIDDLQRIDTLVNKKLPVLRAPFKPDPNKAVLYSAIFPGLGQIYNRKYWKLPIVYGGFMGFSYAVLWNNKNLQDYGQAYKDMTYDLANYKDEPENWHQSWMNFVAAGADPATRFNENFRTQLKRGRDMFRRNRDLSIILTAAFYLICMADSYVDAQLFDFDISPDLSMRIEPVVSPGIHSTPRLYGINCSFKF